MHQHPHLRKDLADELRSGLDERAALMSQVRAIGEDATGGVEAIARTRRWRFAGVVRARLGGERSRARAPRRNTEAGGETPTIVL